MLKLQIRTKCEKKNKKTSKLSIRNISWVHDSNVGFCISDLD